MSCYIGTSGYTYSHWINNFYPEKLSSKKMFGYYAEQFSTVEINYSFYHIPREKTILNWYQQAPDNFKYTLKMSRIITHIKRLNDCSDLIQEYNRLFSLLKEKQGTLLFQMPPSFHLNEINLNRLNNCFNYLQDDLAYAIEFRHNSWFESEEPLALCRKFNVAFCIVSGPKIKFLPADTSGNIYIRMHGKDKWYHYNYSEKELEETAELARHYLKSKHDVWVYFNNDFNAFAPQNALALKEMI